MDTNSGSLIESLLKGELKLHELDEKIGIDEAVNLRKLFLEKRLGIRLRFMDSSVIDPKHALPNIENMIGVAALPIGVAGPIMINGEHAKGEYFIPLATTEGALVASVSRGSSAISRSGGCDVRIMSDSQTRSILMTADSLDDARSIVSWIRINLDALRDIVSRTDRFLSLDRIESNVIGRNVFLRIHANTSDAMGMNMITIAAKAIGQHLEREFPKLHFISESANYCTDKKAATLNLISSRGKKVIAEVKLKEETINSVLKTTGDRLVDMNYRKNLLGSAAAGSLGFNAHFSNMVAAVFIATGQDPAHVVDGSIGFTLVEKIEGGVVASVTLTSLQVGTIGGGTGLPTQKECLSILGCSGPGSPPGTNSRRLAEIVASAVLAGEISLLSALCSKDLAKAHQRLNR